MMAGPASPIDIATPARHASSSPAQQYRMTSNLTMALQGAAPGETGATSAMNMGSSASNVFGSSGAFGHQDSFSGGMSGLGSQWNGTRPISMKSSNKEKTRRESVAGSLMGGMSWGGVSVGSWIRDDIIMAGTSPFAHQSPSYHSSSYLPKLEANFMRDFSCCGLNLPGLHELIQHYEESHTSQVPPVAPRMQSSGPGPTVTMPDSKAAVAAGAAAAIQRQADLQRQEPTKSQQPSPRSSGVNTSALSNPASMSGIERMRQEAKMAQQQQSAPSNIGKSHAQTNQDMDTVEDMEMDDDVDTSRGEPTPPPQAQPRHQAQPLQQTQPLQFPSLNPRSAAPPQLSATNISIPLQAHQGLRTSQISAPSNQNHHGLPYNNNPTVSSVNTPTLSTQHLQQYQQLPQQTQTAFSPESSVPGTPGELEAEFITDLPTNLQMPSNTQYLQNVNTFGLGYGAGSDMVDLCIDEPAKRLFSPNGTYSSQQQFAHYQMNGGQANYDPDALMQFKQQNMIGAMAGNQNTIVPGEEPKPFKCPVIGCEKAYKNQNGLKYHKVHGHQNQTLQNNEDGTFSILDPQTSAPYPGTLGMEKEKPYRCEACGKRYKNLNGLKYHKSHSPACNPDLKPGLSTNNGLDAMSVNMPGGLSGIREETRAI